MIDKEELLKLFTEEIRLALEEKMDTQIDPNTTMEEMIKMIEDDKELISFLRSKAGRK